MIYILPFLSVLTGYLLTLLFKFQDKTNLKLILAFSGSFLLSLTVMHLLPDVYESKNRNIGLYIMIGILFQIGLEFFSQGAEHGHVHGHGAIEKMPWMLFLSLCIHAFLEGFPIQTHHELATGIAIHHFPISAMENPQFVVWELQFRVFWSFCRLVILKKLSLKITHFLKKKIFKHVFLSHSKTSRVTKMKPK